MVIEHQNNDIISRVIDNINMGAVQRMIDYIYVLEIVAESQGTEE